MLIVKISSFLITIEKLSFIENIFDILICSKLYTLQFSTRAEYNQVFENFKYKKSSITLFFKLKSKSLSTQMELS